MYALTHSLLSYRAREKDPLLRLAPIASKGIAVTSPSLAHHSLPRTQLNFPALLRRWVARLVLALLALGHTDARPGPNLPGLARHTHTHTHTHWVLCCSRRHPGRETMKTPRF
ncbi:hypothetical protein E2C01_083962 [Portunus trituberculatus]|uniref:Uncharacterized protein n=1 Tax=Portunus trituberculatus TaxID=210409 RepID=A0A5B7J9F0_PORTR|nr:hypothetical protein [Portunus trituberculatus]